MKHLLSILCLFIFSCDSDSNPLSPTNNIEGCLDVDALNYNEQANTNDYSCEYDTTPPNLSIYIDDDNFNGEIIQDWTWETFQFSAYANDSQSAIDYLEAWIDNTYLGKEDGYGYIYANSDWYWSPTFYETEGNKTFKVRAYDIHGNYTEKTDDFTFIPIDDEDPFISNFNYSYGGFDNGVVTFTVDVTDNREVERVEFDDWLSYGLNCVFEIDYSDYLDEYSGTCSFSSYAESGEYTVKITAYDEAGNTSIEYYDFYWSSFD